MVEFCAWVRLAGTQKRLTLARRIVCQPASPLRPRVQLGRRVPARLNLSLQFATWPLRIGFRCEP